jgi:hypothetical protein
MDWARSFAVSRSGWLPKLSKDKEAVPKAVNTRKKLKNVKKKFFEITESSTSPWDIMPC